MATFIIKTESTYEVTADNIDIASQIVDSYDDDNAMIEQLNTDKWLINTDSGESESLL